MLLIGGTRLGYGVSIILLTLDISKQFKNHAPSIERCSTSTHHDIGRTHTALGDMRRHELAHLALTNMDVKAFKSAYAKQCRRSELSKLTLRGRRW